MLAALAVGVGSLAAALVPVAPARLALGLLAGVVLCVVFMAIRSIARRRFEDTIEPSMETSILAFPPEPRLERRPLSRT